MFGSGYLLDGTHLQIKVEPLQVSPGAAERSRCNFTFVTRRGFKSSPKVCHGVSQVATSGSQEDEERAKERAACVQFVRPQINHNRANAGQPNGPSAAQEKVILT